MTKIMSKSPLENAATAQMKRRHFLQISGSMLALAAYSHVAGDNARAADVPRENPFTLGVASGDPLPTGVVLWTRLAPKPFEPNGGMAPNQEVPVQWEIADDETFGRIVQRGTALASSRLAHSVHVEVENLRPARFYFYRFIAGQYASPIGRTRTAPAAGARVDKLTFAMASCQDWRDGFYSAYRNMAREDLDFVVFLGDYTYEYGIDAKGGVRGVELPSEFREPTVTLARYRLQHALYKLDPDLQATHARFPWIVTWDDHDVTDDYAGGPPFTDAASQKYESERLFARRAAAYQAFYEHLPLRVSSLPRGPFAQMYRRLSWGDLAQFSVLDNRQYRSQPPCGHGEVARCAAAFDPRVTMTGPQQERWLLAGLDQSKARWNVIAQQVLMAQFDLSGGHETKFWQDAWDGYPAARNRILSHLHSRKIRNPIVITGDWHSTFVNDLKMDFSDPNSETVASEFLCTSITSGGPHNDYGAHYGPSVPFNPHIKFFDGDRRGYIRCTVDHQKWLSDLRMVTTVEQPDAPIYTLASFAVENDRPGVQTATMNAPPDS